MPQSEVALPEFLQLAGHPLRWRLLRELSRSDRVVSELTGLLGEPQNLISYHLGKLRDASLVSARRSSADRRDSYYTIDLGRIGGLLSATGSALHPGLRLTPPSPARAGRRASVRVLFLCTGNSARSQIAEALVEHRSAGTVEARSAGSHPKPLHPNAVRVMAERGIDISDRTTKSLTRFARNRFDRVITLCDKVREICPEFPRSPVTTHWSMPDPAAIEGEKSYAAFVAIADELETRIGLLLTELSVTAKEVSHGN
jgi:ArsR family transcriptional regulator, arsenate/arsenite/antimonite-responsive transcriptional repressor / arsenate reductase (thioredoxin)